MKLVVILKKLKMFHIIPCGQLYFIIPVWSSGCICIWLSFPLITFPRLAFFKPAIIIACFPGASVQAVDGGGADPLPLLPLTPHRRLGKALPLLPAGAPAHCPCRPQRRPGHPLQQGKRQSGRTRVPAAWTVFRVRAEPRGSIWKSCEKRDTAPRNPEAVSDFWEPLLLCEQQPHLVQQPSFGAPWQPFALARSRDNDWAADGEHSGHRHLRKVSWVLKAQLASRLVGFPQWSSGIPAVAQWSSRARWMPESLSDLVAVLEGVRGIEGKGREMTRGAGAALSALICPWCPK